MAQHEQNQSPQEVTVNPRTFELMQTCSRQAFGKEVGDLNFDEASRLIGGVVMAITQNPDGKVTNEGRVVIDAKADGQEALTSCGHQMARKIDDQGELVINVTGNKTFWDSIRGREPKVERTFRFPSDPPQYA